MSSFLKTLFNVLSAERPPVELNERGEPEYRGSGVPAVGARNLALGDAVDPLLVCRPGRSDPVAVQVPLSIVTDHPQLELVLRSGLRIEADPEPLVQIPWPVWQEHAEQTVGLWLPERDADGLDRALAIAVRELRFAQHETEARSFVRSCLVVLGIRMGRSRRYVADFADLSVTRVQQLNEDPPPEVTEFVRIAALVVGLLGEKPCPREEVPRPRDVDAEEFDGVIDSLLAVGLLEEVPEGLCLTDDGSALRSSGERPRRARRERKHGVDGERAGDADR
jgi:hypothetical protein